MGWEILLPVIAVLAVVLSSILTGGSFLKLIVRHSNSPNRRKIKLMWLTIASLYLFSEILLGYGIELFFTHVAIGASTITLLLDTFDFGLTLYGIGSSLMQTVPMLPMMNTNKTSAFALTIGLFLFSVMGLNVMYSWYPQTSSLILRVTEICGFAITYLVIELLL